MSLKWHMNCLRENFMWEVQLLTCHVWFGQLTDNWSDKMCCVKCFNSLTDNPFPILRVCKFPRPRQHVNWIQQKMALVWITINFMNSVVKNNIWYNSSTNEHWRLFDVLTDTWINHAKWFHLIKRHIIGV